MRADPFCRFAREPRSQIGAGRTVTLVKGSRRLEVQVKPPIEAAQFGSITLGGTVYDHDVLVCPNATVKRRKKKLSKAVYGTSHTISLAEAKYVYGEGEGAQRLIIGSGQYGRVELSPEAAEYLARKRCDVVLLPTPDVIATWNEAKGKVIGLFHVTC
jgi:hypothetical protein